MSTIFTLTIEEAFSKVKTELKRIEIREIFDTETAVLATITTDDCKGWISHSSAYNYTMGYWLVTVTECTI